jgi:1,2-diacylglycerol 3-alpha-glucosyltransferase
MAAFNEPKSRRASWHVREAFANILHPRDGMKIVYATDNYWPRVSGIAVSIDAYTKELSRLGHEVYLLAPDYPGAKAYDNETGNKNVYRFPSMKLFFSREDRLVSPLQKRAIFGIIETIKPDIIHAQTEFSMGIFSCQYAEKNNIPLIVSAHTLWEEYSSYVSFIPKFLLKKIGAILLGFHRKYGDLVVTPSVAMKAVLRSYHVEKTIRVIPTGVALDDFHCITENEKRELHELIDTDVNLQNRSVLLYVGRIGAEKNIAFLIDVVGKIAPLIPGVVLLIVGDGPHRAELETVVRERNLAQHVVFAGYVLREKLVDIYARSDVFVFASKTETQGLVIVESLRCGTPVVALGAMGITDVMASNIGGFMVGDDLEEFCKKTMLLLQDRSVHERKSKEAIEHSGEWTIETTGLEMQSIYESVL